MLFNSYQFIFIYLPAVFFVFLFTLKFKSINLSLVWLIFASLLFYSWWNPWYLLLLVPLAIINYYISELIMKFSSLGNFKLKRILLTFGIVLDIGVLFYFKYTNFLIQSIADMVGTNYKTLNIILPLGISFFIFQKIAYLVDAYRGEVKNRGALKFVFFVSFFPQLIAGPIVHHKEIMPQLNNKSFFSINYYNICLFLTIFSIGLAKKLLIADTIAQYSSPVFYSVANGYTPNLLEAWFAALSYSMQIYFDFSGYCDMAIALGLLFGIKLPINFNSPYKSFSIIEFWRRWHITLSRFLRDYVYIPFGGNKNGSIRRFINLFLTMLIGGFWHGANWTFIIWGTLHGFYLIVNHAWKFLVSDKYPIIKNSLFYKLFCITLTYLCVVFAWVFFRSENTSAAIVMIKSMLGFNEISLPLFLANKFQILNQTRINFHGLTEFGLQSVLLGIFISHFIAFFMPNTQEITNYCTEKLPDKSTFSGRVLSFISWKPNLINSFIFSAILFYALLSISQVSEFIYFQF